MNRIYGSYSPVSFPKPRRRKWLLILPAAFLLIAILFAVILAGYVGWNLTHPERKKITVFPDSVQLTYQNVEFQSSDNVTLRAWLIPAEKASDRMVIFAHGYRNNRSGAEAALPTAKALYDQGIASLLFDFRNSGDSDGNLSSVGQLEKNDLLAAIDYAKKLGYTKLGLIGFSMGASTSLVAAAVSPDVQAVVADSPFADLRPYLQENLPVWSDLPSFPFTPMILWEASLLTGLDPGLVRPIEAVKQINDKPLFLIHSKDDESIPSTNSTALMNAVANPDKTTLWLPPGTKHVGAYESASEEYLARVTSFIIENLQ